MIISFDEMVRYILMLKEEEMDNNYKLTDSQINLNAKVREGLKNDPMLRTKFSKMMQAGSLSEMKLIWEGKEKVMLNVPEQTILQEETMDLNNTQEDVKNSLEKGKSYVLEPRKSIRDDKRAGYVDALVMALVTGFIGGIATAVLMMML